MNASPWYTPQYSYRPPTMAICRDILADQTCEFVSRTLGMLADISHERAQNWILALLPKLDLARTYVILSQAGPAIRTLIEKRPEAIEATLSIANRPFWPKILACIRFEDQWKRFHGARIRITNDDVRFVLATVSTVNDGSMTRKILTERFGAETDEVIDKALFELVKHQAIAFPGEGSDIPAFMRQVFTTSNDAELLLALAEIFDAGDLEENKADLLELAAILRGTAWLKNLFV